MPKYKVTAPNVTNSDLSVCEVGDVIELTEEGAANLENKVRSVASIEAEQAAEIAAAEASIEAEQAEAKAKTKAKAK